MSEGGRRPDGMPVGTPFQVGNKAGTGGRTKSLLAIEREIRDAEAPKALALIQKLYDLAMGNIDILGRDGESKQIPPDMNAAKLWLDRVIGPVKERSESLDGLSDTELERRLCEYLGITPEGLESLRKPIEAAEIQ